MAQELDAVTLARAQQGEASALERLVRCYERPVFALCSRLLCGRRHLSVEDVAQEAFVRVIRGICRFDPAGPARLSTWVLTIATRACLNSMRTRLREEPFGLRHDEPAGGSSPETATLEREQEIRIAEAMGALPEQMRAVLVLRAYHDLDYPEIAAALDLEVGTVKSRLARARVALRAAMERLDQEKAS